MNIKIGAIIKKLRAENNITQDVLATAIGVTPQAISRWEAEGGYPDIELLPALADFFSVSTDELLGYKLSQREEEIANNIYDYIVKFADYGFNKAHSVAYAQIAYITAYLKRHYFIYYLSVLMNGVLGSDSDIMRYYQAATRKKIQVIGPNINISDIYFSVDNKRIVFPLSVIRGLGIVKTNALIDETPII